MENFKNYVNDVVCALIMNIKKIACICPQQKEMYERDRLTFKPAELSNCWLACSISIQKSHEISASSIVCISLRLIIKRESSSSMISDCRSLCMSRVHACWILFNDHLWFFHMPIKRVEWSRKPNAIFIS